ncbi:MAG: 2-C-methyl-D-erythritol 2,4-cyclodiphosphate synthase [Peptoniphilaceae bacterium]|nr:2-C-methyl-D-erythritol 2,4-cyclodiphosphate synthase [Peptoniphilaceae bacterium]MDY6085838.1 2-C-methyl-D-erythritol 2,4-cyclodiphosphate synthase [Peptoniphilaceae bacterium]
MRRTFRTGIGYDVHELVEGRALIVGGVRVPFEKGLLGHSDADVLVHAINDALLGAVALGDIGQHFPDTDPQYEGADSLEMAQTVARLVRNEGYEISNVDSVLMAQRPKMAPFVPTMRQNVARALGIDVDQVSIKATTTEHLGFVGREEGMAAMATVLVMPNEDVTA